MEGGREMQPNIEGSPFFVKSLILQSLCVINSIGHSKIKYVFSVLNMGD